MIPFSGAARRAASGDFLAAIRMFGTPAFFNTIAPDPAGDPIALRRQLGAVKNWCRFPANDDGFMARLRQGMANKGPPGEAQMEYVAFSGKSESMRLGHAAVLSAAVRNPIVAAEEYHISIIRDMFEGIYGISLSGDYRRTKPNRGFETCRGAFGFTPCGVSVTECSGKGWLHSHGLYWAELPSWVIQAASKLSAARRGKGDLERALRSYIDVGINAKLDPRVHMQSLLRGISGFEAYRGALYPDQKDSQDHISFAAERTNIHNVHGSRCTKGPRGHEQCSQAFPKDCGHPPTTFVDTRESAAHLIKRHDPEPGFRVVSPLEGADDLLKSLAEGHGVSPLRAVVKDKELVVLETGRPYVSTSEYDVLLRQLKAGAGAQRTPLALELTDGHDHRILVELERATRALDADKSSGPLALALKNAKSKATRTQLQAAAAFKYLRDLPRCDGEAAFDDAVDRGEVLHALMKLALACHDGRLLDDRSIVTILECLPREYQLHFKEAVKCRNSVVTEFNDCLTAVYGCNNAVYALTSGPSAQSALFYLLDYLTKDPVERASTLSLAQAAKAKIDAHPSTADDTGTSVRTAQHFLSVMMNSFNSFGEYSAMIAAICNLGAPPEPMTHIRAVLNVANYIDLACEYTPGIDERRFDYDSDLEEDIFDEDTEDDGGVEDEEDEAEPFDNEGQRDAGRRNKAEKAFQEGSVKPDVVEGKLVVAQMANAYAARPAQFRAWTPYEFHAGAMVVPKRKSGDGDDEARGTWLTSTSMYLVFWSLESPVSPHTSRCRGPCCFGRGIGI